MSRGSRSSPSISVSLVPSGLDGVPHPPPTERAPVPGPEWVGVERFRRDRVELEVGVAEGSLEGP